MYNHVDGRMPHGVASALPARKPCQMEVVSALDLRPTTIPEAVRSRLGAALLSYAPLSYAPRSGWTQIAQSDRMIDSIIDCTALPWSAVLVYGLSSIYLYCYKSPVLDALESTGAQLLYDSRLHFPAAIITFSNFRYYEARESFQTAAVHGRSKSKMPEP